MTLNEIEFSDTIEDKTKATIILAADVSRIVSDHDAECLAALGVKSVAQLAAKFALGHESLSAAHLQISQLQSALDQRRFNQSLHRELRDEWAMAVYQKDGYDFDQCYRQADMALVARIESRARASSPI